MLKWAALGVVLALGAGLLIHELTGSSDESKPAKRSLVGYITPAQARGVPLGIPRAQVLKTLGRPYREFKPAGEVVGSKQSCSGAKLKAQAGVCHQRGKLS